jgi:hypothetical protein
MKVDKTFDQIFPQFMAATKEGKYPPITEWTCYENLMDEFEKKCFKVDDYAMKYLASMVLACQGMNQTPQTMLEGMVSFKGKMDEVCNPPLKK